MPVVIATTRVASDTAVALQSITTTALGGRTPVAAWFIVTYGTADGTAAADAVISVGAATATDERWAVAASAENGVDDTDTHRRSTNDECVLIFDANDGTIDGEADFTGFIENGCQITWGDLPTAAYLLTVVFFAGVSVDAFAGQFATAGLDVEVNVNGVGFEPDVLMTAGSYTTMNDATSTVAWFTAGVVANKAAIEQYSYGYRSENSEDVSLVSARIDDDNYGNVRVTITGAVGEGIEYGNFDSAGFSAWSRVGGAVANYGYLALAFNGVVDFEVGIIDSPTANGNQSITDPGFLPQFAYVGLTQMQAVDTSYATGLAGSFGLSAFDIFAEYSNAYSDEDAVDITNTQSLSDDTAVNLPQDDGTAGWVASFVSFDVEGWTWNFSASLGTAVKWWYLAIEKPRSPRYGFTNFQIPGVV